LLRITIVIKTLGKSKWALRDKNENIYQESNGNFLSLIKMIAKFDLFIKERIHRIKTDEIHNHWT